MKPERMMGMLLNRRGFTLVELLVVVGVIALLAAIALPNFLEAQTRSRVAAAVSDLRTYAGAIEAYTVDHGRPPYDGEPGFVFSGWVNGLKQLTTPVAYLGSLQPDAFQDPDLGRPTRSGHFHHLNEGTGKHVYDYSTAYWNDVANDPGMREAWRRRFGLFSQWKMTSAGPDRSFTAAGSSFGMSETYDPTNGTLSAGDIVRSSQVW